ncbi:S-adenosyl-L-methionine-dependent methyltransferase [Aspergillus karnatakaensis]|uniref:S-adenosyl-L-methionine-dependent methyltransferase n=1 Tax=Aspergillus karnatakaensis TaxID=1810916 RepID=UPI003CCD3098
MQSPEHLQDSLITLARDVLRQATALSEELASSNASTPESSEPHNTDPEDGSESEELRRIRSRLITSAMKLQRLALGPTEHVRSLLNVAALDAGTMRAIVMLKIPQAVPFDSSISYEELARQANVDCDTLTRIIRYCITNGVFKEEPAGNVQHTEASAALARGGIGQSAPWRCEVSTLANVKLYEAIPAPGENPGQRGTAFNVAFDTTDTMYEYRMKSERLRGMFAALMASEFSGPRVGAEHVVSAFDWSMLDRGVVVDVGSTGSEELSILANFEQAGGGTGHISKAIAEHHSTINFIVQDLYQTAPPESAADEGHVEFQHHDFFSPQTVPADAFFFRYIFHNWSDVDVVRIIQALKPVLRVGTRLLVNEYLPRMGIATGGFEERVFRERDMQMLALMNGKERTLDDLVQLVSGAEPRFSFVESRTPPGSSMSVLHWVYE